jgi:uncharacterized YigZ family protein
MISNPSDEYLTIKSSIRSKTKVEGSSFIATATFVNSEKSAEEWIQKISQEFFDATHNCFAWRTKNVNGESLKFSDAGEPRGTAGKPILSAIESENLYNVLVVVTRYFGGVKLGTGGLSRAYRQSAQRALQKAEKVTSWITEEISLSYPLNMTGKVSQIFSKYNVRVKNRSFEKDTTAKIVVRSSFSEKIKKALLEATNGQVKFN